MTRQAITAGGAARRNGGGRTAGFVPIRDEETGRLLFRFDPVRLLVEIVQRRERILIDLRTIEVIDRTKVL